MVGLWDARFENFTQFVFIPLMYHCLVYAKQHFIDILCLMQNLHVVRETDAKKLIAINFGR